MTMQAESRLHYAHTIPRSCEARIIDRIVISESFLHTDGVEEAITVLGKGPQECEADSSHPCEHLVATPVSCEWPGSGAWPWL